MKKSLLIQSFKIAQSKIKGHPEYNNYIHYSFIVQDNKIIEWGVNNSKLPPIHYGYQKRIGDKNFSAKTHSEPDAFRKAKGILNFNRPFDMINIRLNKTGQMRISKPCSCCYDILKAVGCRKFYYSSDVGFMVCV